MPAAGPAWADELRDLAAEEATGRMVVTGAGGEVAWLWLRDGWLAGVSAAIRRPLLSRRLVAFGLMHPQRAAHLVAALRDHPGQRLLEVLVRDRLAPAPFLDAYQRHLMAEQLAAVVATPVASVRFEPSVLHRTCPIALEAATVLADAAVTPWQFGTEFDGQVLVSVAAEFPGCYPIHRAVLAAADAATPLSVADQCGLTVAELLHLVADLRRRRLLTVVADDNAGPADPAALDPGVSLPSASAAAPPDREPTWPAPAAGNVAPADRTSPPEPRPMPVGSRPAEPAATRAAAAATGPGPDAAHPAERWRAPEAAGLRPPNAAPPEPSAAGHRPDHGGHRPAADEWHGAQPAGTAHRSAADADGHESTGAGRRPAPDSAGSRPRSAAPPTAQARRDAMSLLAGLGEAAAEGPEARVDPAPREPQAEVTTTSVGPIWTTRRARPVDPMAATDVFRELQSLGGPDAPAE